jgi:hypothetical protein
LSMSRGAVPPSLSSGLPSPGPPSQGIGGGLVPPSFNPPLIGAGGLQYSTPPSVLGLFWAALLPESSKMQPVFHAMRQSANVPTLLVAKWVIAVLHPRLWTTGQPSVSPLAVTHSEMGDSDVAPCCLARARRTAEGVCSP